MRKLIFLLFWLIFFSVALFAQGIHTQESILVSYERNFIRASLPAKSGILLDAARDEGAAEFIGVLYEFALQFVLNNVQFLRDDPDMILLVSTAARGAGTAENRDSVTSLLRLFDIFSDSQSRVEILGALGTLGKDNPHVINNINNFVVSQNTAFRAGTVADYPVLRAAINALGSLGDNSSFSVLFSTLTAAYPQTLTQDILVALDSIQGNHKDFLTGVIRNNPFPEKAAAFRIGAYNERFSPAERGEIAQTALEVSLNTNLPEWSADFSAAASLRYDAIAVITRLRWTPASALAIRNFYRVQSDFMNNAVPRDRLIEAINCLEVMSTAEAAQALALQLAYKNSQTERNGEYDEVILLAIINALGELGDKAAFDHLLYISYLNYPDRIQASAREAINRLQW